MAQNTALCDQVCVAQREFLIDPAFYASSCSQPIHRAASAPFSYCGLSMDQSIGECKTKTERSCVHKPSRKGVLKFLNFTRHGQRRRHMTPGHLYRVRLADRFLPWKKLNSMPTPGDR
jgi:hypothetical protein